MRKLSLAPLAAASWLLVACSSGPTVRVDRDPATDMHAYKSFAFFERTSLDHGRYASLQSQRVRRATREELEKQGYVYNERMPDLRVNVDVHVRSKQALRSAPGATRPGGYRAWSGARGIDTVDYRDGTLSVDLVDARRNALVWRGVAEGRVDEQAMKDPNSTIEAVVGEIFEGFPHGKKQH